MSEKIQERTIPFNWSGWDPQDELQHSYYSVEFTEDFGVFEKGEKFDSIFVDYGKGLIESYEEVNGELQVSKNQFFKATPIV